jgi:hypothetical protein
MISMRHKLDDDSGMLHLEIEPTFYKNYFSFLSPQVSRFLLHQKRDCFARQFLR